MKRVKPVCGSDGRWYKNTCTLRYHRCIVISLQRDLTNISCKSSTIPKKFLDNTSFLFFFVKCFFFLGHGVPVPDFTASPPPTLPPPTPSGEPTFAPQACFQELEEKAALNYTTHVKCRYDGKYRPVQCWKNIWVEGGLVCVCTHIENGSGFVGTQWRINCATEEKPL